MVLDKKPSRTEMREPILSDGKDPTDPQPEIPERPLTDTPKARAFRRRVLFLVSLPAFLVPITTTIYLPSLNIIEKDLDTSAAMVGLTISSYVALFAFMPLIYGPYSDRVGRRPILQISLAIYIFTSLLCSLSWSIETLIAFRSLQALGVSAAMVVGAGAITDVFPRGERGRAMGVFGVAPLIGPIIGPPMGGVIEAFVGWRGIFYILAATGIVILVVVSIGLPETLVRGRAPGSRANPLQPLGHLRSRPVALWALLGALMFGTMYAIITMLPGYLDDGYGLEPYQIGLAMIPFGLGSMTGTILGGRAADRVGRKLASIRSAFLLVPAVLAYAWTLGLNLAMPIAITFVIGFFLSYSRPGLITYCIELKPHRASGMTASLTTTSMLAASLASFLGPAGAEMVGEFWVFTIAAMLCLSAAILTNRCVVDDRSRP